MKAEKRTLREDLKLMKKSAMIVDVACDDEGAVETCRSTTHDDPVYREEGILHYCVDNIPSAFARTASIMLSPATAPYLMEIAGKGVKQACAAFKKHGMQDVAIKLYPEGRHEMLNELNKDEVYKDLLGWIESKI